MSEDYARIARALRYMQSRVREQPGLETLAAQVRLSPYHFQRLFRQWVGISPKRYLEFLTVNHAKRLLPSHSVLDTSLAVGLSGPSRLHDQFASIEAISPGEYKKEWHGIEISYGITPGPFGDMLIAQTARGVCLLAFMNEQTRARELARMQRLYQRAHLKEDTVAATNTALRIFNAAPATDDKLHLYVRGTNFQVNVWRALLALPAGNPITYRELAERVGKPIAIRAAANAVAANPINYLIPCHRVLRADGTIGGFRGGTKLKQALLEWESDSIIMEPAQNKQQRK